MAEYKADGYNILARDFRILYCFDPPLQLTENTSNYLIRCCHRVNHFFEGAFNILIKDIKSLDGVSDDAKVGNHWILDKVGDMNELEKLIREGHFNFDDSEQWL
jgi:hypothetical protein